MTLLTLVALVQGEGAKHVGPGSPFEINTGLLFWTWVVFLGLLYALWKFAYPLIVRMTEERERTIARQLQEAEQANAEARRLLEEHRRLQTQGRAEAQAILAEARAASDKERASAVEKARQETEQLLERTRLEIAIERDKAAVELRREAVDLALAAATKLIGERLGADADRALVADYLASLERIH
jgi:F-type H+-transporting ATPase subunit b